MLLKPLTVHKQKIFICSVITAILFGSCADKIKSDLIGYHALDESLQFSIRVIDRNTTTALFQLEQKIMDPTTRDKAAIWYPKAQQIVAISKNVFAYIDDLKTMLRGDASGGKESFKENDKNAVMRIFSKQGNGKKLYDRLKGYRAEIFSVDPEITKDFGKSLLMTTADFDTANEKQDFTKTFFNDIPAIAAVAMLSKLQNNIKANENRMILFCDNKVGYRDDWYQPYSAFVGISAHVVKPGEKMEILAGVGAFSKAALPVVTINSKNIPLEADGAAHFQFKANANPGKYNVLLKVDFTDENGKKKTISKNVEYTVSDCK